MKKGNVTIYAYSVCENVGKVLDRRWSVHLVRGGAWVLPLDRGEPPSNHVEEFLGHFEVDEDICSLSVHWHINCSVELSKITVLLIVSCHALAL